MTDLCHLTALEHKRLLDSGALSSLELVDAQIARITRSNPEINAFVTLDADRARDEARRKDDERARGNAEGVLHGLTVRCEGLLPRHGGFAPPGGRKPAPATCRIMITSSSSANGAPAPSSSANSTTPEFTMARNTCDNPVFGATRNPWDTRLCPGALQWRQRRGPVQPAWCRWPTVPTSEGPLRNPAAWCNVVGHRPTSWMVPDVPNPLLWHNMNSPGPMARSVADAALFLSVLAGPDPRSPVVVAPPFPAGPVDLAIDPSDLSIGWSCDHGSLDVDPSIRDHLHGGTRGLQRSRGSSDAVRHQCRRGFRHEPPPLRTACGARCRRCPRPGR